ncbi:DUF3482 domain-containing protein [Moraxella catarrhalis]|uniref:Putative integral membrane protein n=1 Tax=Moraxella catarrhalis TaxID=480 RepID=A0A198UDE9_MORCA|nr:DUF3482 domain-containing protein [Moraxella catarrhalis]OAU94441.1 putative integral membrane protein [Moraxella catarrhalis]OAU94889.1 putative integral membrane protein [Moraxella catarrhalis]OAU99281.1 putative integral membrane protein [Moraxella catarrhalis]
MTSTSSNRLTTISVIGHTNVGKTSLLRTLLRDSYFGEVQNASATTRHVSAVDVLSKDNVPLITLHDTPGLEDATGVMDFLQDHTNGRADGVERLSAFLQAVHNNDARLDGDFSQEAKVIKSLLEADIALYIIDAKEPVLGKYKDELAILAGSGTPILPVFNFINHPNHHMQTWREMLSRRALHVVNAFDTIAFDFENEMALWSNLSLLSNHDQNIERLKQERSDTWHELMETGSEMIADFLINVAAYHQKIASDADATPTLEQMQNTVRQGESILHDKLLNLYRFYHQSITSERLDITSSIQDVFDSELLAQYGIRTAGGSVTGMIIGAGIDVATLGASLGLGTAIGGVIGGLLPNSTTIKDKAMGVQTLMIDAPTITLLAARAQNLHHHLRHRGHASFSEIAASDQNLPWQSDKLPSPIKKARSHPKTIQVSMAATMTRQRLDQTWRNIWQKF